MSTFVSIVYPLMKYTIFGLIAFFAVGVLLWEIAEHYLGVKR